MGKKLIAVDIGSYYIKTCMIEKNKRNVSVTNFKLIQTPRFLVQEGRIVDKDELAKLIFESISNIRVKNAEVVLILNDNVVITRDIELPAGSEKELDKMVKLEASGFLPNDISQYTIRYKFTNHTEKKGISNYLMVCVKTDTVNDFIDVFKKLNLKIVAIDTTLNCIIKALNFLMHGCTKSIRSDKSYCVIDIGASNIKTIMFCQGEPCFQHVTGYNARKTDILIANSLGIETEEAEQLKIKYGLKHLNNENNEPEALQVGAIIASEVDLFLNGIYKNIDAYNARNPEHPISKIYLSGGVSNMLNLPWYITRSLNITCSRIQLKEFEDMHKGIEIKFEGMANQNSGENFAYFVNLLGAAIRGDEA